MSTAKKHNLWMSRALELAREGEGLTRPNPPVGAIVVAKGRAVGEGSHRKAGGPHAEIIALRQAEQAASGATLYVTLEPCSTHGRTGPCTEAIIAAGIRRVVVSVRDPNPAHRGRGLAILRKHGVEVIDGILAEEGGLLIAPFSRWITTGRPFVRLKLAMSLDGRIAVKHGDSKWITGSTARTYVHSVRRRSDAILIGYRTACKDDPQLLPRPARGRHPLRVILDARGSLPLSARVLSDRYAAQTLIVTTDKCSKKRISQLRSMGVDVLVSPALHGRIDVRFLMGALGARGILSVLCEGGGELAEALMKSQLVDECLFFYAPILIGGINAKAAFAGSGWNIGEAPPLKITTIEHFGQDILIQATPIIKKQNRKGDGDV